MTTKPWPLYGYAPGNYENRCTDCKEMFEGDKRAFMCLDCAAVRAKEAVATAATEATDAARWRALMGSARLHFMGCAGFEIDGPRDESGQVVVATAIPVPRPGEQLHFGMEFWSEFAWRDAEEAAKYPDRFEREFMVRYADELRRRASEEPPMALGGTVDLAAATAEENS